ncbi:hypothetical protein EO087_07170 [Dyella sp. M7H15-1]|uniref:hypothetical protein n=1 Tax=Dyella sp. M7H15-1 TaxID=2501295 RepID=UPI001004F073|nr:hypothetical protein [Dyella sp. M7H15-1]QAU23791.1 hypothetical protein EO087_07170 [Dyella sp. M7H15-1]
MRSTPLLLGCLLSFCAVTNATAAGTLAANGMNAGSGYHCTDHSAEPSTHHDNSSVSGDAMSILRSGKSSSTDSSSNNHASSSNDSADDAPVHMSGSDTSSDGGSPHSSGLGWQSLLPGSIQ